MWCQCGRFRHRGDPDHSLEIYEHLKSGNLGSLLKQTFSNLMAYMYLLKFKYFVRNLPTPWTCIKHWKVLNTQMKDLRSETRKSLSSPDFKGNWEERKSSLNKNSAMHGWCYLPPKSNSVLIWCFDKLFGIIKTAKSASSLRQFDREQ